MSTPESTPGELGRLIARLSDGTLAPVEAARLNELLRADPVAQEAYLEHLAMDAMLEREFGGAALAVGKASTSARAEVVVRGPWRRFRGWGQMAAGLVIGAFLASAVWAYALPLLSSVASKLLPLVNADFETNDAPAPEGVPIRPGVWSGDFVKITGAEGSVVPHSGARMLRFLRADDARTAPGAAVRATELWQVVDLRPLRGTLGTGTLTLQLDGWFNAAPHPARRYTCGVALVACRGEAAEARSLWSRRHEVALAESDREERLDDEPGTWQRVETQLAVPPDAELLLVQVRIYDKTADASEGPSIFPAHYADDVSLRLLDSPGPIARISRSR